MEKRVTEQEQQREKERESAIERKRELAIKPLTKSRNILKCYGILQ